MLGPLLNNALQPAAQVLLPEIGELCVRLKKAGALGASMTGSGSAVFGLFETADLARQAWEAMRGKYRDCFLTAPQDRIPILA